ncbi:MAG: hypothetical protein U1E76_19360 [Planctomycetota bacterium]
MIKHMSMVPMVLAALAALGTSGKKDEVPFSISRIYIEYNATANDLGFHVSLDGEDWKKLKIVNPENRTIFDVQGKGPYKKLGMTELFFEGAEPSLDDFPLDDLLALFPEGDYRFSGKTVDGKNIVGTGQLSHAVPAGPGNVFASVDGKAVVIHWDPVTGPPRGFPRRRIHIVGYQIIVDPFQVTLPGSNTSVTLPPEFVASLAPGEHPFEVLAIDASGNQTITESSFVTR